MSEQNIALPGLGPAVSGPGSNASSIAPGVAPDVAPDPAQDAPRPAANPAPGLGANVANQAAAPASSSLTWLELLKWAVSFPAMLGMLLVGRVFYEGRGFSVDPDMWWHIKVGQDLLRTHQWPTFDLYSWTAAGTPWIAYEWLGEVPLALVHRLGGLTALDFFLIALASVIMLVVYWLAAERCGNSKAAFVSALFLTSLAFGNFSLRPQMFGFLFLVLTLLVMEKFRQGVNWVLWTLPPIFLLWVNTHGSFIIGIGVIVLYLLAGLFSFEKGSVQAIAWTRSQRIKLETALLLCIAVLPITPYGSELAVYPFDMAFSQPINVANISEWKPMPFDIVGGKMFLGFIIIFFLLQMFFRFTWRLEELLLAVGGTAMACLHVRFVLLFVPFFAPVFAASLARWVPGYKRAKDQYLANAVIMAAVVIAMFHYFPKRADLEKKVAKTYPVAALQYLKQHPVQGRLLNDYGFGGYLVLSGEKTFIDGRGDLFERSGVLGDFVHMANLKPGAFGVLRNYDVQACLLQRDSPFGIALAASSEWRRIYMDETSVILARQPVASAPSNSSSIGR
jgi:hypothetical protein